MNPLPSLPPDSTTPRYQPDVVNLKAILTITGFLVVLAGVSTVALLYFVLFRFVRQETALDPPPSPYAENVQRPAAAPPLKGPLPEDLYAPQHARLSQYAWIDRSTGRMRVPIERAMELVVQRAQKKEPPR